MNKTFTFFLLFISVLTADKIIAQSNFQITFNATGTALANSDSVYVYAGIGWQHPDDHWQFKTGELIQPGSGIGKMASLGNNLWSICLEPYSYFSQGSGGQVPAGATIYNVDLKFHNKTASIIIEKSSSGNDIFISMANQSSTWEPVVKGMYQNCTLGIQHIEISNGVLTNYPNPVKESTTIVFSLTTGGDVKLNIMNSIGNKIFQLVSGTRTAGIHSVVWNCVDQRGLPVKDGMYFFNLEYNGKVIQTNKMVVSRK